MAFPTVTDRNVQYPNRVQMTLVSEGIYDLTPVPGTVTEAGTAVNKALFDAIGAAVLNQEADGTVDDLTVTGDIIQTNTQAALFGDTTVEDLTANGTTSLQATTTEGLINTGSSALGNATVTTLTNLDDTDWYPLTSLLQPGWTEPYPLTDPIKIRRWGNFVQLKGVVAGTSGAGVTILTVPSEYAPQDGSDHNAWVVGNSAGVVTLVEGKADGKINFFKGNQATGNNSLNHMWMVG